MIGVTALSNAISSNALSTLMFGGLAYYDDEQEKMVTPEVDTLEVGMTKADFSNKNLGAGGAIIVGAWISYKDNGALTSLDLSSNKLRAEGVKIVAEAIKVLIMQLRWFWYHLYVYLNTVNCCCLLLSTG
jgi:hypothetical protein